MKYFLPVFRLRPEEVGDFLRKVALGGQNNSRKGAVPGGLTDAQRESKKQQPRKGSVGIGSMPTRRYFGVQSASPHQKPSPKINSRERSKRKRCC